MKQRQQNHIINEKRLFFGMAATFVCLLGVYMYLLSATVMHVVLHTEVKQEINLINSDISELENRLILAQHKVSADIATLEGFTNITHKVFVDRAPASLVLGAQNLP